MNGQLLPQDSITSESSNEALFENLLVYGVGKGVAVDWNKDNLNEIWTEFVPTYHVPKIESNSQSDANLSIEYLADPKNEILIMSTLKISIYLLNHTKIISRL